MNQRNITPVIFIFSLISIFSVTGCSGRSSGPQPSLETARQAVQGALNQDAPRYAPTELALAQDKLRRAEDALHDHDNTKARRLSEQATVDARFAEDKSEAEQERIAANETERTAESLK